MGLVPEVVEAVEDVLPFIMNTYDGILACYLHEVALEPLDSQELALST